MCPGTPPAEGQVAFEASVVRIGSKGMLLEHGESTSLVILHDGEENNLTRKRMSRAVEFFEDSFPKQLADWNGDVAQFRTAGEQVRKMILG